MSASKKQPLPPSAQSLRRIYRRHLAFGWCLLAVLAASYLAV